ncbi:hypothetical protein NQ318_007117 [Aromia moschata]|uniref:HTH CENPB-type domain-containing protein n=1 Tax=Aromia moschata TaxID=1265417 RepID=A0AAV8XIW1_9CUCU|nr:hypothetical protein NQ318_007117 [Aromia moschata]
MPRKYVRKLSAAPRAQWTEKDLGNAITHVTNKSMGVNEASRVFNIPSRTLRRRISSGNHKKISCGKLPALGIDNEKRLVKHIQKLQHAGFAPNRLTVRRLAYQFVQKLGLEKSFESNSNANKEKSAAGYDWLRSFLERNPCLSVRKSEGLSLARAKGMSRDEVDAFFQLLKNTIIDNDLQNSPGSIFNMDETGIQMNNKPISVIVKDVHVVTASEKGENVSIIACNNAEGMFLPPVLILKGVRKNPDHLRGLPPGSDIYMNSRSSYVNSDLFLMWLKNHFAPRKGAGKCILILDGHVSHCSIEMLEFAELDNIIILCLPSHTTQALQPLDKSFFKPLKDYFKQEADTHMFLAQSKTITRMHIGELIGNAWQKAATVGNGCAGFRATGIYPLDPQIIPDHFFQISDTAEANAARQPSEMEVNLLANVQQEDDESNVPMDQPGITQKIFFENDENDIFEVEAGTLDLNQLSETNKQIEKQPTPSKYLDEVVPIPAIPTKKFYKRKQSAAVLTSAENMQTLKQRKQDKLEKEGKKQDKLNKAKKDKKKPPKPEPKKAFQV